MGSHGGILTEGGMITFAFWKDPPKSSIERAGQEAGRPRRRPSWSTSRGGWPLPKGRGGGHPRVWPLPRAPLACWVPFVLSSHCGECGVADVCPAGGV